MNKQRDLKQQYKHQLTLRRKYGYSGLLLFVISIASLAFISELRTEPWFFVVLGAGLVGFLVGLIGINYWSRCPACNKIPRQRDGAIPIAAMSQCPHCGVSLSEN
ncbi:phage terminase large subunit family protein [Shewanella aegiceratis]|uniref:phage terminase large subunit family protein n=1 Tax=Shewanella aegiceratis TaxID=2864203 RepID=UPI001C66196A|nr:phage terminase large subunit family protein [Shewanella aegiceratis]QYJ84037.1 phage terminase large subunit family protein [Shewanella aegiceratis]